MPHKIRNTPPPDYSALTREFVRLRTEAGLSQHIVSVRTGISESQIGRIERAEGLGSLSFQDVVTLGRLYNLSPTRAAEILGLWPVEAITDVEADSRMKALASFVAMMPDEKRELFIEMIYRAASALADVGKRIHSGES